MSRMQTARGIAMKFSRKPTLPTTLEGLDDWGQNWLAQMGVAGVNFATFGLAVAPAGFDALYTAFHDARIANLPPAKTPDGTAAQDEARQQMLDYVRPIINQISGSPEGAGAGKCTRANKILLRVNPRFNSKAVAGANVVARTPNTEEPTMIPEFDVKPVDNLTVKIRVHFGGAPLRAGSSKIKSSRKPDGVANMNFYYKLTAPVPGRNFYEGMVAMTTKNKSPFTFTFDPAIGGRQVYIAARYTSTRGKLGDWSGIRSVTVPIEGVAITNVPLA
jgi:hypothetical protein